MPGGVVYPLEVVHVEKDRGELLVPAPNPLDLPAQLGLKVGAVDEVGPSSIGEIQDDARLQERGRDEKRHRAHAVALQRGGRTRSGQGDGG